ncbi:hypothetical protein CKM354_001293200 [Cercospora kikuchii]|uniref:Uncharacterized protein n=1 Tax=Cercospora kikuchii TaxID=84275 RepID=A0A9P3L287_9PEZI|nr:uncharacterized protein CKM354_001293200 [Cercospora kikuchii]GIZ49915.1 hypothetical protein CKM354_001293200 [Cercospora kikuchii]
MSANTSNNSSSSNNTAPQSQPTPKHQVYDPLAPPPTNHSQFSPESNGTSSTDDFAAEPFAGLEDPFGSDEGGAGTLLSTGSSYQRPPNPAVPAPQQDENAEAMRTFVQEMIETRTEPKEWDERVEVARGQGQGGRARPGSGARERLRMRAERRRERMGVLEEVAVERVAERVDEAMEVEGQEEEVVREPKRKKIRLSEQGVDDGKKRDG